MCLLHYNRPLGSEHTKATLVSMHPTPSSSRHTAAHHRSIIQLCPTNALTVTAVVAQPPRRPLFVIPSIGGQRFAPRKATIRNQLPAPICRQNWSLLWPILFLWSRTTATTTATNHTGTSSLSSFAQRVHCARLFCNGPTLSPRSVESSLRPPEITTVVPQFCSLCCRDCCWTASKG